MRASLSVCKAKAYGTLSLMYGIVRTLLEKKGGKCGDTVCARASFTRLQQSQCTDTQHTSLVVRLALRTSARRHEKLEYVPLA